MKHIFVRLLIGMAFCASAFIMILILGYGAIMIEGMLGYSDSSGFFSSSGFIAGLFALGTITSFLTVCIMVFFD